MAEHRLFLTTDELEEGGYLKIEGNQVTYLTSKIRRNITNPEERVRAEYYLELIKRYKYPDPRIQPNCKVPGRKPDVFADIVVFEDDEKKKPYIVVECKQDGISQAEIQQTIEQVFGYANSLRAKYATVIAGTVRIAFDVAGFKPSEREKNIIADIPERYGKVIKYRFRKEAPENDLKVATRGELLRKFQQCHDTLWEGGKRNPAEAFDEMSKLMFCKIWDERFITKKGEYYKFQVGTHETLKEVTQRIRGIYLKAQKMEPGVFTEEIKAEDPIIYSVVELLQGISLARTELDIKGEAFEHFLGGVFRQAMGQYFTPRPIVKFMVDMLEPNEDDKVIDPACGSGGFLLYTLDSAKKHLEDSLAPRDALDRWKDFALYQLFGIEINSQLARVSMMNMIIHEDGHSNIENNDALDDTSKFHPRRDIRLGKYSLLLTNPPFGAVIKLREHNYLKKYELGAKEKPRNRQNTEILFIERCLDYLRPGGRMGIVLPDGILTNSSNQYVRDFINERAQVLAVVSLPQTAFRRPHAKGGGGAGSGVKASLVFLRKKKEGEQLPDNYPIFMALAAHIGYDSTGRPDKNEFPDIVEAYKKFRKKQGIDFFVKAPLSFGVGRGEIEGRIDPFYYKREFKEMLLEIKRSQYPVKSYNELIASLVNGLDFRKFSEAGTPYLRVANVKENKIDTSDIKYVPLVLSKIKKDIHLQTNDVLVTRKGTFGLAALVQHDKDYLISSEIFRIRLSADVCPKYFVLVNNTSFIQSQLKRKAVGAIMGSLSQEALKTILIPMPPREIQDEIADMMDKAYRIKREKEREAEELLNSIDDYVFSELGIKLPELKEEKKFVVTFDKIKGKRFDPYSHQPKFRWPDETLSKLKYKVELLENIVEKLDYGLMPTQDYAKNSSEGLPMIRVTNITRDGYIDMSNIKYIKFDTPRLKEKLVKQDDVLMVQCGNTTGKVALVTKEFEGYTFGSFSFVIRGRKDIVDPYYLYIILSNPIIQQQVWKDINISTVRPNTSKPVVGNLKFPLPPLSVQQKIAKEVDSRRAKTKTLNKEAKEVIIKAKQKVEKMIL